MMEVIFWFGVALGTVVTVLVVAFALWLVHQRTEEPHEPHQPRTP